MVFLLKSRQDLDVWFFTIYYWKFNSLNNPVLNLKFKFPFIGLFLRNTFFDKYSILSTYLLKEYWRLLPTLLEVSLIYLTHYFDKIYFINFFSVWNINVCLIWAFSIDDIWLLIKLLNLLIQVRNNLNGNSSKWFTNILSFEATTSKGYLESF